MRDGSAATLQEWLAPMDLRAFRDTQLGKVPRAGCGTAKSAIDLLEWATLGTILASGRPIDLVTVAGGRLVQAPKPRSLADARALMRRGGSVVVRAAEEHDDGLAKLAASFGAALAGEVHVQVYATPRRTNSYGWHFDFEDVFIAQTAGVKDYYFRPNTVARDSRLGDDLDFTVFRREVSPISCARLIAGDCLYIPARWWHLVKCEEDSLSISVGVMSPQAIRTAKRLPAGWSGHATPDPGAGRELEVPPVDALRAGLL
jgi:hypothetical protein